MSKTNSKYYEKLEPEATERKQKIGRISKSEGCFFEKTNKIDKLLLNGIEKEGERMKICKTMSEETVVFKRITHADNIKTLLAYLFRKIRNCGKVE